MKTLSIDMDNLPNSKDGEQRAPIVKAARLVGSAFLLGSGVIGCALAAVAADLAKDSYDDAHVIAACVAAVALIAGAWLFIREWRRP